MSEQVDLPREGKVLLDWTPTPEDRVHERDDIADRYLVLEVPKALSGVIVYALFHGKWLANPWSERPLVRHLISKHANLSIAASSAIESLRSAIPFVADNTPPSCGRCGHPDADCDVDCMAAASGDRLVVEMRRAATAIERLTSEVKG